MKANQTILITVHCWNMCSSSSWGWSHITSHHTSMFFWGTLRSRHGTFVDFDKICVFCSKYCVRLINVFIVVKIKCVNSGKFVIMLTLLQTTYILQHLTEFIKTYTNITNFDTFGGTVPQRDLRISLFFYVWCHWIRHLRGNTPTTILQGNVFYLLCNILWLWYFLKMDGI